MEIQSNEAYRLRGKILIPQPADKTLSISGAPADAKTVGDRFREINMGGSGDGTIVNHIDSRENPHEVTKEQVGLGNVDNTSDMEKPVSNAQREAINQAGGDLSGRVNVLEETIKIKASIQELKRRVLANELVVLLSAGRWSEKSITVDANGVTALNSVLVCPDADSFANYSACGVRLIAQTAGKLMFQCEEHPGVDMRVNVLIFDWEAAEE